MPETTTAPIMIQLVGGPTTLLKVGGLRLVTDPTFSPPGEYPSSSGTRLVKTEGPGLSVAELGAVDAVLLSHDQHPDNLDPEGRAYLEDVPLALTTPVGAARLGGRVQGLPTWAEVDLIRAEGPSLRVTSVPARHGPPGAEGVSGPVTGFVLRAPDLPTIYVSGDNASLGVVGDIADRIGDVDIAVLFVGAARVGRFNDALVTLDSAGAARAAQLLGARWVVPVHFAQWQHLTEGATHLRHAFEIAGLADRLRLLGPGESTTTS